MEYMESYNSAALAKRLYESGFTLYTRQTLADILAIKKESTLFNVINRFMQSGILIRIEKDKYRRSDTKGEDFALANFLYAPSYISFETALNFYGILSQFPHEITSATIRKSVQKHADNRLFSYTHIKKTLYWGYYKKGSYLVAEPEKALADQLYMSAKGFKRMGLDEYSLSNVSFTKLKQYLACYPQIRQVTSRIREVRRFLSI